MADEDQDQPNWTKEVVSTVSILPGITDKRIETFYADAAADPPEHWRIAVSGHYTDGTAFRFDSKMDDLQMTDQEKQLLAAAGAAAVARLLALKGFST